LKTLVGRAQDEAPGRLGGEPRLGGTPVAGTCQGFASRVGGAEFARCVKSRISQPPVQFAPGKLRLSFRN
jgi:hypothetical protein